MAEIKSLFLKDRTAAKQVGVKFCQANKHRKTF